MATNTIQPAAALFRKAVKFVAKGRVALIGPAGSGKSLTSLILARLLAGPEGKIAAIDTEHGSLSKYADLFAFDVVEMDSFSHENFMAALNAAGAAGYSVFLCDSLSHFWIGKDGALEFVDSASKRYKDNMGGWKEFRPHERQMMDAMIASPCHVICTMRTKTDYQETTENGKKKRVKVGLAPVQRDGMEYEFDLVGYMDDENTLIVDKTRCPVYSRKAITQPTAKDFHAFQKWLEGEARPQPTVPYQAPTAESQPVNGKSATTQKVAEWSLEADQLTCHVYDVQKRTGKKGEFVAVKHNGQVNKKDLAFCFHANLFEALLSAKAQRARFLISPGEFVQIIDVIQIGDQGYLDGKPAMFPTEVEPNLHGLVITDEDLAI
jgi:ABC-type oligopeptide transport system ATPase subunit